ncbi:beta-ketoacyl synthase N-terminal-like domain-containing protein [Pseudomonas aeruginosa]
MRRVVITGLGIVSCLGNDKDTVSANLRAGRPGIRFNPSYAEMGLRSHVSGSVDLNLEELIDRKVFRFMGDAAAYAYLAMEQAIKDSGLTPEQISNPRTGLIAGSGGASTLNQMEAIDTLREKGVKRIGPYRVTRTMGSTVSACLATPFQIKGVNYSISSACATSAHCIGQAMEQIQLGKQDVVFAGGGEEEHWSQSCLFDAMGALSTQYNETPEKASRAYDAKRDGFVIAGGDKAPAISSTKSLSGHSLGAAGVHEAIYCLLMMEGGFIAGSANIDELDPEVADLPILRETRENAKLDTVMSNSFGFGGTNATLVLKRWQG